MYYLYDSSVMSRSRLHAQLRTHPLNSLPVPLHTPTLQLRTSIHTPDSIWTPCLLPELTKSLSLFSLHMLHTPILFHGLLGPHLHPFRLGSCPFQLGLHSFWLGSFPFPNLVVLRLSLNPNHSPLSLSPPIPVPWTPGDSTSPKFRQDAWGTAQLTRWSLAFPC